MLAIIEGAEWRQWSPYSNHGDSDDDEAVWVLHCAPFNLLFLIKWQDKGT